MAITTLANIDKAKKALAAATTFSDILEIRDKAAAIKVYLKSAGESVVLQNQAVELKLRAERKIGELLRVIEKNPGSKNTVNSGDNDALPPPETLEKMGIHKMQASRWQRESTVPEKQFEALIQEANAKGELLTQAGLLKITKPHVTHNSGENEWYTPIEYVEPFRSLVGTIDIDPASSKQANLTIQAKRIHTIDDDGLTKKWKGSIWLNPPYENGLIVQFVDKLVDSLPNISHAALLVNNAMETRWAQKAMEHCGAICMVSGRIKFDRPNGFPSGTPLQGQCLLYFGPNTKGFRKAYSAIGSTLSK